MRCITLNFLLCSLKFHWQLIKGETFDNQPRNLLTVHLLGSHPPYLCHCWDTLSWEEGSQVHCSYSRILSPNHCNPLGLWGEARRGGAADPTYLPHNHGRHAVIWRVVLERTVVIRRAVYWRGQLWYGGRYWRGRFRRGRRWWRGRYWGAHPFLWYLLIINSVVDSPHKNDKFVLLYTVLTILTFVTGWNLQCQ